MSWDEARLLAWIRRRTDTRGTALGAGNDAAVLAQALRRPVVCVDQSVQGVHFERGARDAAVGHKAAARALSDLAASAARPRAVLLALCAPRAESERRLRALIRAVERCARTHGAALVGGDLVCGPGPLALTVTALGELDAPRRIDRGAVRPGDVMVATGPFGGSRLGRHLRIVPRLAEGRWLAALGARAMMDVSDGLGIDLARLARASGVRIDVQHVPVHRDARRCSARSGRPALQHALEDGEDHELIAALPARALARAVREAGRCCPGFSVLGRARAGRGLWVPELRPEPSVRAARADRRAANRTEPARHGAADVSPRSVRWNPRRGWIHGGA